MQQHYYRPPWTKERVDFLVQWWPHFGSVYIADRLGLTVAQVKAKVNKLRLRLLPRSQRLCVGCQTNYQTPAYRGLLCPACLREHRRATRRAAALPDDTPDNTPPAQTTTTQAPKLIPSQKSPSRPRERKRPSPTAQPRPAKQAQGSEDRELRTLKRWIAVIVRAARDRSSLPADITPEYMLDLWQRQQGRCFYSGRTLRVPRYGDGRNLFAPSIDRIDPQRGYVQGNVVWATLACNVGKGVLSLEDYIRVCADVVCKHLPPVQRGLLVCGDDCIA
jgi:hypothetical protein